MITSSRSSIAPEKPPAVVDLDLEVVRGCTVASTTVHRLDDARVDLDGRDLDVAESRKSRFCVEPAQPDHEDLLRRGCRATRGGGESLYANRVRTG